MTYKIFTIKSEFGFRTFKFKQPRTGADQKKLGSDFQVRNSVIIRVDSFAFFFSFAKYETVRNRSLFRRVSIVLRNWKKSEKKCFELFRETAKQWLVSYFRIFSFKFCTFASGFVPFIQVVYFFRVSYIFNLLCYSTVANTGVSRMTVATSDS